MYYLPRAYSRQICNHPLWRVGPYDCHWVMPVQAGFDKSFRNSLKLPNKANIYENFVESLTVTSSWNCWYVQCFHSPEVLSLAFIACTEGYLSDTSYGMEKYAQHFSNIEQALSHLQHGRDRNWLLSSQSLFFFSQLDRLVPPTCVKICGCQHLTTDILCFNQHGEKTQYYKPDPVHWAQI